MTTRPPKNFVSLHSHTGFSANDGLDPPEAHIDYIRRNGMDGWCLTEHGHMSSFAQAYLHVEKLNKAGANFKFVPGCEMYLHPDLDQWRLHRSLRSSKDESDRRQIRDQLRQYRYQVTPVLDEDDDIVGMTVEDKEENSATVENEEESKSVDRGRFSDPVKRRHHLVVLPRNSRGLEKLFGLVSRGYREGYYRFPRIDYEMLRQASGDGDLIASTACLAGVASYATFEALQGSSADLSELTPDLLDNPVVMDRVIRNIGNTWEQLTWAMGGEQFAFLELQFNRIPAQHLVNRAILEFADRNGLMGQLVITADSHYPEPDRWRDREIYKTLGRSWGSESILDIPESVKDLKCELYPKNAEQIWAEYEHDAGVYEYYGQWESAIRDAAERTHSIVHDLIEDIQPDRSIKLPSKVVPKGVEPIDALIVACKDGMVYRGVAGKQEYIDRVKHEIRIINSKGTELYFLTYQRIMTLAKKHMLCGPGRGSAAGSLVAWLLQITEVDPIVWGLPFERFMSATRSDLPDIDSDFQDRERMIELLIEEFGQESVLPISTFMGMQISTTVKDVAKVLSIPFEEVNNATRGMDMQVKAKVAGKGEAKADVTVTFDLAYEHHPPFADLMDKYPELASMTRNMGKQLKTIGVHAGGVLIAEDIPKHMPVITTKAQKKSKERRMQTPWFESGSSKQLEPFGWVKFDILGLETLMIIDSAIRKILTNREGIANPTFEQVREWYDAHLDTKTIDFDDQRVYQNVYEEGRWFGIFQCTQAGAQRLFMNAKPKSVIDIATLTSIYRPGPLGANVDKTYVQYKNDTDTIPNMHPLVWKVLKPTYGLLIFQEQVMELAHVVAGIPFEECDDIRRAITKSSYRDKLPAIRQRFIEGAVENGMSSSSASNLWDDIVNFAAYGFNKAHAVSYAIVSYQCAWLLTYYTDEWVCAWCESMSGKADDRAVAYRTTRRWGMRIHPIDVRHATKDWRIIEEGVYMPSLTTAKGIGDAVLEELDNCRPFNTVKELLYGEDERYRLSKVDKGSLDSLIRIGAFDHFIGPDREFSTSNHAIHVLVNNNAKLKKVLKTKPRVGIETYETLVATDRDHPERTRNELIEAQQKILSMVSPELLVTPDLEEFFRGHDIPPMNEVLDDEAAVCWFLVSGATPKTTKNGKPYLLVTGMDLDMAEHRIFVWNWPGTKDSLPNQWDIMVAKMTSDDFGWKTRWESTRLASYETIVQQAQTEGGGA